MCGRFTNKKTIAFFKEQYGLEFSEQMEWQPSYNLAPSQNALVTTADRPDKIELMHFGLVPFWAKDIKVGFKMINARAETVMEKSSFKPLVTKGKRCLVYATNFYEWKKIGKDKQPYLFQLTDREVFAFAGLWSLWKDPKGEDYFSFSIITTNVNELTKEVHERMPVILTQEEEKEWLDMDQNPDDLMDILSPYPADGMEMYPVNRDVGNVKNNHAGLLNSL